MWDASLLTSPRAVYSKTSMSLTHRNGCPSSRPICHIAITRFYSAHPPSPPFVSPCYVVGRFDARLSRPLSYGKLNRNMYINATESEQHPRQANAIYLHIHFWNLQFIRSPTKRFSSFCTLGSALVGTTCLFIVAGTRYRLRCLFDSYVTVSAIWIMNHWWAIAIIFTSHEGRPDLVFWPCIDMPRSFGIIVGTQDIVVENRDSMPCLFFVKRCKKLER